MSVSSNFIYDVMTPRTVRGSAGIPIETSGNALDVNFKTSDEVLDFVRTAPSLSFDNQLSIKIANRELDYSVLKTKRYEHFLKLLFGDTFGLIKPILIPLIVALAQKGATGLLKILFSHWGTPCEEDKQKRMKEELAKLIQKNINEIVTPSDNIMLRLSAFFPRELQTLMIQYLEPEIGERVLFSLISLTSEKEGNEFYFPLIGHLLTAGVSANAVFDGTHVLNYAIAHAPVFVIDDLLTAGAEFDQRDHLYTSPQTLRLFLQHHHNENCENFLAKWLNMGISVLPLPKGCSPLQAYQNLSKNVCTPIGLQLIRHLGGLATPEERFSLYSSSSSKNVEALGSYLRANSIRVAEGISLAKAELLFIYFDPEIQCEVLATTVSEFEKALRLGERAKISLEKISKAIAKADATTLVPGVIEAVERVQKLRETEMAHQKALTFSPSAGALATPAENAVGVSTILNTNNGEENRVSMSPTERVVSSAFLKNFI